MQKTQMLKIILKFWCVVIKPLRRQINKIIFYILNLLFSFFECTVDERVVEVILCSVRNLFYMSSICSFLVYLFTVFL